VLVRTRLDAFSLPSLARGCAVLAAGGGDTELGLLMALRAVQRNGPVELIDAAALPDRALVMPCALVGAPTVAGERLFSGDEGLVLRAMTERLHGGRVAALMCLEVGGVNGLLPVVWAARMGLPLLDADGAGRSFPQLEQHAMHLAAIAASPVVLTDGRDNTIVVCADDDAAAERLVRRTAAVLGGVCAAALYCLRAEEVLAATVSGSVSHALALGQAATAQPSGVAAALGATVLLVGHVIAVERVSDGGFASGSATIRGFGREDARQVRVEMQNEYLVAFEDGAVRASVPDVIALLSSETGVPIATEELRYGHRVTIIAIRGAALWSTEAGSALTGPAAFGYAVAREPAAERDAHVAS
jgi:DUF917 family protein